MKDFINILLKEDPDLVGQDYQNQAWLPFSKLKNPIRRSLCANEIIFDIDANDWQACLRLAKNLEEVLIEIKIPFLRFSSGNWLHYHIFFDKNVTVPKEIWKDYFRNVKRVEKVSIESLKQFLKELRFAIFMFLCDHVKPINGAHFDIAVMKAEKHLIRIEGTKHEKTGFYKSLLPELPNEQPKVKAEDVILPSEIKYWQIPEELLFYVYHQYIKKPSSKHYPNLNLGMQEIKEIAWIENLLQNPLPDGRHRAVDLILAPYLMNVKKLAEEEAFKMIWDWVQKSKQLSYTRMTQSYVWNKLRYAKRKELKPLSKANLDKWLGDVPQLLKQ